LLLTACGTPPTRQIVKTDTVKVGVPTLVALPEDLTRPCDVPEFPEVATVGAVQDLVVFLYTSIEICNQEKASIRDLQPSVTDVPGPLPPE